MDSLQNITPAVVYGLLGTNKEKPLLDLMAIVMIATGLVTYVALQLMPAPYGRYSSDSSAFMISAKLAWIVQESPSFFVPLFVWFTMDNGIPPLSSRILVGLFMLHYFQRTFIYAALIRGGKRAPLATCLLAFIFCTYNGYMQARSILKFRGVTPNLDSPLFLGGVGLFCVGLLINMHSDHILRNLRSDGSAEYKIPQGGMFECVTAANYFGEIVEWIGFALATYQLQGLAFAIFTFSNLVPRGISHHDWYLRKFGRRYPVDRYAVLPLVV